MAYVDGYLIPVKRDRLEEYKQWAALSEQVWREYGAIGYAECIADDAPHGTLTSFPRAVMLEEDEVVILAWAIYPSREVRDEVNQKVMDDPRLHSVMANPPFDGKRFIWGGFTPFIGL
jgi:uncharacterized protein YbaA (DUF1428 family)